MTMKARLVAKGNQDPDLQGGLVEMAGCVSPRSPHSQLLSLCGLNEWRIWGLDTKNAPQQADSFRRDVLVHAPSGWGPQFSTRA